LPITTKAKTFHTGIRGHWLIENSLHYLKDETFGEDRSRIRTKNSPANMSLLRNIVINIFRKQRSTNIKQSIRLVSHNIPRLWNLITDI